MNQPDPRRWSAPTPGQPAPGIVQLAPPLAHPAVRPPAPPSRAGVSPVVVAALALATAVAGAIVAAALALILGASTAADPGTGDVTPPTTTDAVAALTATAAPLAGAPAEGIVVDVAGGVLHPGLRSLREGDRVGDAIAAAGGFAPRADLAETSRVVNLAMPLTDGMKILVPELGTDPAPGGGSASEDDALIDLNSADPAELESLPGIGPVTAGEIIDAREAQPFDSVDDLRERGVVGPSVFEQIRDLVRAGGG